jgi:hypothetical protein
MVRNNPARGVLMLGWLLAGCGASVGGSQGQHGAGSHAGAPGQQHGISKEGLAAVEVVTAVAATAAERALLKECYSLCLAPAVCDTRTGECVAESRPGAALAPKINATSARPRPTDEPQPTCGGLCWPGERCAMVNGRQDCVAIDKTPAR